MFKMRASVDVDKRRTLDLLTATAHQHGRLMQLLNFVFVRRGSDAVCLHQAIAWWGSERSLPSIVLLMT